MLRWLALTIKLIRDKPLADLYGVEGGTLTYLITAEPEGQAIVVGQVLADAAHKHVVLAGGM